MRRTNIPDVNTPANYDEIYFGWRTEQLPAHQYFLDMLKSLNVKKGNVLDVGCGLGRYFPAFKGSKIYGTELSTRARKKVLEDYPEAKVIEWFAGTRMPYEDNFFNLIWAGEFLEHVQEPQRAIDEIYRVLAPAGTALFTTPVEHNSECPEHLWFFDQKEIEGFFSKYEKKQIRVVANGTRFEIILTK